MRNGKIALTGGIATGKSTVAAKFRELGAEILDADEYARRAVEPGTQSWGALREMLGPDFFNPDGFLKRRELREKIVREPECREQLNAVLHPYILEAMWADWETLRAEKPGTIPVFDIPLLFEGGFEKDFDIIILVYAPPETQILRLMRRDGLSREEARRTLSIQYPIETKKALSTYLIDNSGDIELTLRQAEDIWEDLSR
ncbi:MAG: dephospho-CoA kinase [Syntrophobacteraceae bacterium]